MSNCKPYLTSTRPFVFYKVKVLFSSNAEVTNVWGLAVIAVINVVCVNYQIFHLGFNRVRIAKYWPFRYTNLKKKYYRNLSTNYAIKPKFSMKIY